MFKTLLGKILSYKIKFLHFNWNNKNQSLSSYKLFYFVFILQGNIFQVRWCMIYSITSNSWEENWPQNKECLLGYVHWARDACWQRDAWLLVHVLSDVCRNAHHLDLNSDARSYEIQGFFRNIKSGTRYWVIFWNFCIVMFVPWLRNYYIKQRCILVFNCYSLPHIK